MEKKGITWVKKIRRTTTKKALSWDHGHHRVVKSLDYRFLTKWLPSGTEYLYSMTFSHSGFGKWHCPCCLPPTPSSFREDFTQCHKAAPGHPTLRQDERGGDPPLPELVCPEAKFWSWPGEPEQMDGSIFNPGEALLKLCIRHPPLSFLLLNSKRPNQSPQKGLLEETVSPSDSPHFNLISSLFTVCRNYFQFEDSKGKMWQTVFPTEAALPLPPPPPPPPSLTAAFAWSLAEMIRKKKDFMDGFRGSGWTFSLLIFENWVFSMVHWDEGMKKYFSDK